MHEEDVVDEPVRGGELLVAPAVADGDAELLEPVEKLGELLVAESAAGDALIEQQRADLGACLDTLIADSQAGRAYFKVYRQFKMYNDPKLNPYLYDTAE